MPWPKALKPTQFEKKTQPQHNLKTKHSTCKEKENHVRYSNFALKQKIARAFLQRARITLNLMARCANAIPLAFKKPAQ